MSDRFHIDCDCRDKETCKLFWNLDNFNDYELEESEDRYGQIEEQVEKQYE